MGVQQVLHQSHVPHVVFRALDGVEHAAALFRVVRDFRPEPGGRGVFFERSENRGLILVLFLLLIFLGIVCALVSPFLLNYWN